MSKPRNLADVILSNKQWMRRLRVVMVMEEWVAANLKKQGPGDSRKRSPEVLINKGKEYFYGYLFWGRRVFPVSTDPLFFDNDDVVNDDGSLISQLTDDKYPEFINILNNAKTKVMTDAHKDDMVLYADVIGFVGPSISDITRLSEALRDSDTKEHEMIGLILRYRCVGGFDSNLHGSVTENWASAFAGYTECFASPLNHKFEKFHSLFDNDAVFGGQGDFFQMVRKSEDVIPSGFYEINPPFHSELLHQVAKIVEHSFESNVPGLKIVMMVPIWANTEFIPTLDNIRSITGTFWYAFDRYSHRYTHTKGVSLVANTRFYVLASNGTPQAEFDSMLHLCRSLVYPGASRTLRASIDHSSQTLDRILKIQT